MRFTVVAIRVDVRDFIDQEQGRDPGADRDGEQYRGIIDDAALQPGRANDRNNAESDGYGKLAETDRGETNRTDRVENSEGHAREAKCQNHWPIHQEQQQPRDRCGGEQADAESRHAASFHDAGLDESRAAGIGINAVRVVPICASGVILDVVQDVGAGVNANRGDKGEHEQNQVELPGDFDAPGCPGQDR